MASLRFKTLGIVFLALLMGGVYLTYAIFTQKFTTYDEVTLETSSIGLQLPNRADVKIRGVIVGQVTAVSADADGATVTLGIEPDQLDTIPAGVTGAIVPKTLFGEKYVALEVPQGTPIDGAHIQPGAVIDKTEVSVEVEKVLSDLYPLLETIKPGELNMTLNAIASALEGRGEQLGENLETVDSYLKRFNPQIPQLVDDLRLTAKVSNTYADVLPQVGQILRDTVTTATTLRDREAKLNALFNDVSAFSDTARTFIDDNSENIIAFGNINARAYGVLAKYAPEFSCLTKGIVNAAKLEAEAFRGFTLHIVLETLPNQPRGYTAADRPHFGDNRGPNCLHLPNPPWSDKNPVRAQPNFDDGVNTPTGKGTDRIAPSYYFRDGSVGGGYVGSASENQLLRSLIAPALGVQADDVSDLGVLLVGPMARGAKVSLR